VRPRLDAELGTRVPFDLGQRGAQAVHVLLQRALGGSRGIFTPHEVGQAGLGHRGRRTERECRQYTTPHLGPNGDGLAASNDLECTKHSDLDVRMHLAHPIRTGAMTALERHYPCRAARIGAAYVTRPLRDWAATK